MFAGGDFDWFCPLLELVGFLAVVQLYSGCMFLINSEWTGSSCLALSSYWLHIMDSKVNELPSKTPTITAWMLQGHLKDLEGRNKRSKTSMKQPQTTKKLKKQHIYTIHQWTSPPSSPSRQPPSLPRHWRYRLCGQLGLRGNGCRRLLRWSRCKIEEAKRQQQPRPPTNKQTNKRASKQASKQAKESTNKQHKHHYQMFPITVITSDYTAD